MKSKKLVLALGESTHTHVINSPKEIIYEFPFTEEDEIIDFEIKEKAVITHEEHDRIVLEKGKYIKFPQMEYDPFANEIRRVYD